MNGVNWWGIMFFVFPIVLTMIIAVGMTAFEILRGLWRLTK